MNSKAPNVSLLGCGWLGVALAQALIERGAHVRGSTTQSAKLAGLTSLGIEALLLRIEPLAEGETVAASRGSDRFFESETLIVNLPPEAALGPKYHLGQLEALFSDWSKDKRASHLIYVSSTSVYGSRSGEVDEASPLSPDSDSGAILVAAENYLAQKASELGFSLTIVRSAGLIGPGRHPGMFLTGRKNLSGGQQPVNMIHQMDLALILANLAMTAEKPPVGETQVFNAAAATHPTREEFYGIASQSLGVQPPTFADDMSPAPHGKLVKSDKIRKTLSFKFKYDDLYSSFGAKKP